MLIQEPLVMDSERPCYIMYNVYDMIIDGECAWALLDS